MRSVLVLILITVLAGVLSGQSTNPFLIRHVTDPSKASIVEARVAAISTNTNVRYDDTTNRTRDSTSRFCLREVIAWKLKIPTSRRDWPAQRPLKL